MEKARVNSRKKSFCGTIAKKLDIYHISAHAVRNFHPAVGKLA